MSWNLSGTYSVTECLYLRTTVCRLRIQQLNVDDELYICAAIWSCVYST